MKIKIKVEKNKLLSRTVSAQQLVKYKSHAVLRILCVNTRPRRQTLNIGVVFKQKFGSYKTIVTSS
jgi:hypothetical protein